MPLYTYIYIPKSVQDMRIMQFSTVFSVFSFVWTSDKKKFFFFLLFFLFSLFHSLLLLLWTCVRQNRMLSPSHILCVWVKNISNRKFHKIFLGFAYCCVFSIKNFVIFFFIHSTIYCPCSTTRRTVTLPSLVMFRCGRETDTLHEHTKRFKIIRFQRKTNSQDYDCGWSFTNAICTEIIAMKVNGCVCVSMCVVYGTQLMMWLCC